MSAVRTVSTEVVLDLTDPAGGVRTPVTTTLGYDADSPYAVEVTFHVSTTQTVEWVFARDLLADGLTRSSGDGDVRVQPAPGDPALLEVHLTSPTGSARFVVPLAPVRSFLARTFALVPQGRESERLDLDNELDQLIRRSEWRGV